MKKSLILILIIGAITACNRDEDQPDPTGASPIVTILAPGNNSTHNNGDSVFISAIAYDDKKIAHVEVKIRHKASGINLFTYTPKIDGSDTMRIDTFYKVDSPIAATGVITVYATDDEGKSGQDEVTITIKN